MTLLQSSTSKRCIRHSAQVPGKRASLGSGAPQPKRPRGRGRPPPGKSKLSISGKPAPAALPPLSMAAATESLGLQVPAVIADIPLSSSRALLVFHAVSRL